MLVLNTLILGQHEFFKKAPQSEEENPILNPGENQGTDPREQLPEQPILDPSEAG